MLAAVLFYTCLFLVLVGIPCVLLGSLLLLLEHERTWWPRVRSVASPIVASVQASWPIRTLSHRHPRLAAFVARRLDRGTPWGLPATVAELFVILGLWLFLGVVQDLVARDPLVVIDLRLHNSVPLFRTAGMTRVMLALTALGSPLVLWFVGLGGAALAVVARKPRVALTLVAGLATSSMLSITLKALIGHARPDQPLVLAQAASFPSGHQLMSAVVYGLYAILLLGTRLKPSVRGPGVVGLVLLVAGVGLSRLYLGVHWPSDILASLALAIICLAALVFLLRYPRAFPRLEARLGAIPRHAAQVLGAASLLGAAASTLVVLRTTRMAPVGPPPLSHAVELEALQMGLPAELPRRSEDLLGNPMEPLSLVLIGSRDDLTAAFRSAGWSLADSPTPLRVVREAIAAVRDVADPSGPATPAYMADRPPALTFEKPGRPGGSIRSRHHARVWPTPLCLSPSCRPAWVATASFDAGIEMSPRLHLPTHRIDPDIDAERRLIVADLEQAGASEAAEVVATPPLAGTNAAGDGFQTDGRAALLVLPEAPH